MFNDVLTSIKAYLYDRVSSPLLGAIATSIVLWNFKILMLFFSNTSYAVKVWEIDNYYSQPFFEQIELLTNYWMCIYIMPLLTSLFYIYIFPWFSHRVFEYSYSRQVILNNKKKSLQGSEFITTDEKDELLNRIEKLNVENRANTIKFREEITSLDNQLNLVIREREDLKTENEALRLQLHNTEAESPFTNAMSEAFKAAKSNGQVNQEEIKESSLQHNPYDVQQPEYVKFYEKLDWEQKDTTEKILSILLESDSTFEAIESQLIIENQLFDLPENHSALKKHMGKLKLYDIVDVYEQGMSDYYILTDQGKSLYKRIIEA